MHINVVQEDDAVSTIFAISGNRNPHPPITLSASESSALFLQESFLFYPQLLSVGGRAYLFPPSRKVKIEAGNDHIFSSDLTHKGSIISGLELRLVNAALAPFPPPSKIIPLRSCQPPGRGSRIEQYPNSSVPRAQSPTLSNRHP